MTEYSEQAPPPTFFDELRRRRVLQIFGFYLGGCWGLLQFIDWLVKRYLFSPSITDLALTLVALLIPTVLMLAYFHGKPGADQWTQFEKIGIPLNLLIAAALLAFIFGDKNLGKLVQKVRLQDEEGQEIVRVVPKQSYIKKLAVFYFDPVGENSDLNWQAFTLPLLLFLDLSQDSFIQVKTPFEVDPLSTEFSTFKQFQDAGFGDGIGVPLTLQAKVARNVHAPVFMTGRLEKRTDGFHAFFKIYESENSRLKASGEISKKAYLEVVDQLSIEIKKAMGIPEVRLEATSDLPVKELLSDSPEALQRFAVAMKALMTGDLNGAITDLESAIKIDPTFAQAYQYLQYSYLLNNQHEKRNALYKQLMKHLYKLPEREKYFVKAGYYVSKGDVEKGIAVVQMVTKLFPQDITGWSLLALFQSTGSDMAQAIASYGKVLELDPYAFDVLLTIGDLYLRQGKYDKAAAYYQKYVDQLPDQIQGYQRLGELYLRQGDYEKASENFEKALLIEPENVTTLLKTGEVAMKAGKFSRTLEILEAALDVAERPEDKFQVYQRMQEYFLLRGELQRSFEAMKLKDIAYAQFQRPFLVEMGKLDSMGLFAYMGKVEEAEQILKGIAEKLSPPMDRFVCVGEIILYLKTENQEALAKSVASLKDLIDSSKNELMRPLYLNGQARVLELQGDEQGALENYEQSLKLAPDNTGVIRNMGICLRKLGKLEEAEARLNQCLKLSPFNPKTHYEMALLKHKMGQSQEAEKHLDQALEIWKDADADYQPAAKARAQKEAWRKLS